MNNIGFLRRAYRYTMLLLTFVFLLKAPHAIAQPLENNGIAGTWRSTYLCNGVVDAVVEYTIVEIGSSTIEAAVAYHITKPSNAPALFLLRGSFDPKSGQFDLLPYRWVNNSNNVPMLGIRGRYDSTSDILTASFNPGVCWGLSLTRLNAPVLDPNVYTYLSKPKPSPVETARALPAPSVETVREDPQPEQGTSELAPVQNAEIEEENTATATTPVQDTPQEPEAVFTTNAPQPSDEGVSATGFTLSSAGGQLVEAEFDTLPTASVQIGVANYVDTQLGCGEPLFVSKVSSSAIVPSMVEAQDPLGFVLKQEGVAAFREYLCPDVDVIEAGRLYFVSETDVLGYVDFSMSIGEANSVSHASSRTMFSDRFGPKLVDWRLSVWSGSARRVNGSFEKEIRWLKEGAALHLLATHSAMDTLELRVFGLDGASLDRGRLSAAAELNHLPSITLMAALIMQNRGLIDAEGRLLGASSALSDTQKNNVTLLVARAASQGFLPAMRLADALRGAGVEIDRAIAVARSNGGNISYENLVADPDLRPFPSESDAMTAVEQYLLSSNCKVLVPLAQDLMDDTPGGLGRISEQLGLATNAGNGCVVPFGAQGHLGMGIGRVQSMKCTDKGLTKSCYLEAFLTCHSELSADVGLGRVPECGTLGLERPMEMRLGFSKVEDGSWKVSRQESAPIKDLTKTLRTVLQGKLAQGCEDIRGRIAGGGAMSMSFSKGTCRISTIVGAYADMWFADVIVGNCQGNICTFRTENECYAQGTFMWGTCGEWLDAPWSGTFRKDAKGRVADVVIR